MNLESFFIILRIKKKAFITEAILMQYKMEKFIFQVDFFIYLEPFLVLYCKIYTKYTKCKYFDNFFFFKNIYKNFISKLSYNEIKGFFIFIFKVFNTIISS